MLLVALVNSAPDKHRWDGGLLSVKLVSTVPPFAAIAVDKAAANLLSVGEKEDGPQLPWVVPSKRPAIRNW